MTAFSDMARQLKPPTGWFPDGTFRPAAAGATFQTRATRTGEVTAELPACTAADVSGAHRCARKLKAGTVSVNTYSEGDIATPFGGVKQSGFGGRDNVRHAHEQYTEPKTIRIDLTA